MNLFLAAMHTNWYGLNGTSARYNKLNPVEAASVHAVPNILESYHYVSSPGYAKVLKDKQASVFLDSGAFSAHTLGVTIDLPKYCQYIKDNIDILRVEDGVIMASVLDGIGDPLKTWQNQLSMEALGVRPLPCFHFGEDPRYLEHYVANYPYITIGGLVGRGVQDVLNWLDEIWTKYMLDGAGRPKLKVHAFGVTSVKIMERYPWYSVDSSSWVQIGVFGSIFTEKFGTVCVSSKSPSRHDQGRHFTTFTQIEQNAIRRYIEDVGFEPERMADSDASRLAFNCQEYCKLNDTLNRHFDAVSGRQLDCHVIQRLF